VQDARRFVKYHKGAIESYPLQSYASALLFSPTGSLIRKLFQHEEPEGFTIKPRTSNAWSACLQTLEGHSSEVMSVAFSPDSARLVSASHDNTVKIWDASSSVCLQTLNGHSDGVMSVTFSHDSAWLASASWDKTVKIWDTSSGVCLLTLTTGKALYYILFDVCGPQLHTEVGTIDIAALSSSIKLKPASEPYSPQFQGISLSADSALITYDSQNVV
jgi:WD40 repeat protein